MIQPPINVSVTLPVSLAYERVKRVLFEPFDLGKWFVIGFCAWLAYLGEGGMHANFPGGGGSSPGGGHGGGGFRNEFDQAKDYVMANLYWILPVVIAVIVLSLAFWVLITWISSRGRFMFLHCVALNRAEVGEPWRKFAREGNSLCGFRIVCGLIGIGLTLPLLVPVGVLILRMVLRGEPDWAGILVALALLVVFVVVCLALALIYKFTKDFVEPIMFLRRRTCWEGWRELLGLMRPSAGEFTLYVLFQIVLSMAIGMIVLMVILVTCCVAGCLMLLPYLGTVLLLPILVFQRSYSLYYLAQFGRDYDVFPPPAPPAQPPMPGSAGVSPTS